ncbi:hypothetical protein [aff. Roholtiella sp. LEGE 12411]|uniref:hypothetical protein n=1 Tax=aff. Roholtiella sp. LEGE 12411 TaxID=1828822 RepID=UPI00187FCCDE|nr:hypothetical protein [aff. Roholtiella sp. LEGE 12411]MBE9035192.1 hypothetical protein [aff. Roholtiella sp. LEGE 12411]
MSNFESQAHSIHESTSAIVDRLINLILQKHQQMLVLTGKLLDSLLNKPTSANIEIQIKGQKVYDKQGDLKPTVNLLTLDQVNELKGSLDNPSTTKGSVRILIDDKPILDIKDGQVLRDDLGLIRDQTQSLQASKNLETEQGISSKSSIIQAGTSLITQYGYQVSENISAFRGQTYSYERNNESFTIHAYGRGAVFKDGDFTALATEQDQKTIMQLPEKVKKELSQNQQQVKQKSLILKNQSN